MSSMSIGTRIRIHFFQMWIRGSRSGSTITERWLRGSGSGSTFPKCGSQDSDSRQNEMDPKRWKKKTIFNEYSLAAAFFLNVLDCPFNFNKQTVCLQESIGASSWSSDKICSTPDLIISSHKIKVFWRWCQCTVVWRR